MPRTIKPCVQLVIIAVLVGIIQILNIRYLRASSSPSVTAVGVYLNLIVGQSARINWGYMLSVQRRQQAGGWVERREGI